MHRRVLPATATAFVLWGAYTLYATFLTPLFSPPSIDRDPPKATPFVNGPPRNLEQARKHLTEVDWTYSGRCYHLRQDGRYMYAQDWERVEPSGEVRFKPFAMIWHREGETSDQPPITIVCDAARLQFEVPFDDTNPKLGRIVGGALEGTVRIRGADGLKIDGQNFQFSESSQRLWSDQRLSFAYGLHSGSALGLELDLIPGTPTGDKPAITGVKTVRLRRDVDMTMVQAPANGGPPETIHVTSVGMFEFHVRERQAAFQKKVRVEHPVAPGVVDSLTGELLTLIFEPPPPPQPIPGSEKAPAPSDGIDEELELRRVRAEGSPAVIVSPRSELVARAAVVTYDVQARTARLTHPEMVDVVQKASHLRCPDLTLSHTEDGEIVSAHGQGAGTLDSQEPPTKSRPKPPALHAEWKTEVRLEPDPERVFEGKPLQRITLSGQALVRQPGQLKITSDTLQIWVAEKPLPPRIRPPVDGVIAQAGGVRPASVSAVPNRTARPKRMLANGNVHFEGAELTGATKSLEATFEDGTLPLQRPAPAVGVRGSEFGDRGSEIGDRDSGFWMSRRAFHGVDRATPEVLGRPSVGWSAGSGDPRTTAGDPRTTGRAWGLAKVESEKVPAARKPAKKPLPPATVVADGIRLRIVQDGEKTDVVEVWNDGDVVVTQPREAGEPSFELRGNHLHLVKYSDLDQSIQVFGEPALIRDRGFEIEGRDLSLDRGQNNALVQGPGRLRLPIQNSPDGKPLPKLQPLDVSWTERMTFNGQTATFVSGVAAVLDQHRMRCEQMEVRLLRGIRLASKTVETQKAELHTILCQENVEVDSRESEKGILVSVRQAKAWEFTIDQVTGDTRAQGPGSISLWERGASRRSGAKPAAGVQANRPLQTESVAWEYSRIGFAGTMNGNTNSQTSTFADRVDVLHGPVSQVNDVIDAEHLPRDAGHLTCDKLTFTQHGRDETKPGYVEFLATGNTRLEARPGRNAPRLSSYHMLADSISFDESKDLYLVRSLGTRGATIWRKQAPHSEPEPNTAQRMEFIPSTNNLKVTGASGLSGID